MREHQIVINLKREHFEEVQRLARLSGAKSVGAYLRDRVLAFLEADRNEAEEPTKSQSAGGNLDEVSRELARMHRELQVFIAESLSQGAYAQQVPDHVDPSFMDEAFDAYEELQQSVDQELQTFRQSQETGIASGATGKAEESGAASSAGHEAVSAAPSQSEPSRPGQNQTGAPDYSIAVSMMRQRGLLGSQPPRLDQKPSYLSELVNNSESEPAQTEPVKDDLEELADRAFAISPRLGALSGTTPADRSERRADPLQDLLDDNILEQAEKLKAANEVVYAPFADDQFADETDVQPADRPIEDEMDDLGTDLPEDRLPAPPRPTETSPAGTIQTSTFADDDDVVVDAGNLLADESQDDGSQDEKSQIRPYEETEVLEPKPTADPPGAATGPPTQDDILPGPPPKRSSGDQGISGGPPPKRRKK